MLGTRVYSSGCKVQGSRFRVYELGCKVQGSRFRVYDLGCKVQGSRFRVQVSRSHTLISLSSAMGRPYFATPADVQLCLQVYSSTF